MEGDRLDREARQGNFIYIELSHTRQTESASHRNMVIQ